MARPVLANASERVAPPATTAEDRLENGHILEKQQQRQSLTGMKLDISSVV